MFSEDGTVLHKGQRETTESKLWWFSLRPQNHDSALPEWQKGHIALNAHNLPSVGALDRYLHAAAGFPVKSTCISAIKAGNYSSSPGLTYANASKYCPLSIETLQGHL